MREADLISTTSPPRLGPPRRLLLALAALAPIAAFPAVAVAMPDGDDSALIRLGAQLDLASAREDEAWAACDREDTDEAEEAAQAANEVTHDFVDQIEALRATTLAGIQVEIRALLWCKSGDLPSAEDLADRAPYNSPPPTTDMRLIATLLRDLAAMGRA